MRTVPILILWIVTFWCMSALGTQSRASNGQGQVLTRVGLYKMMELVFRAETAPTNPFDTYLLRLEVTDPAGRTLRVEGFYDGDGRGGPTGKVWKARLCPYMTGIWRWKTIPGDAPDRALSGLSGRLRCVPSDERGGLVAKGRYFMLQDGTDFYPVGHFLDEASRLPLWSFLGDETTDAQRNAIIARQRHFHDANKYMFYMSNHSDASAGFKEYVTPWPGNPASSNKQRMDLARWHHYDTYLLRLKDNGLLAYMSLFEDGKPGNYADLSETDRNRLLRYVMARTSAYSHLWYVLCFEWQEAWTREEVNRAGLYLQAHNPWKRLVSVHDWAFAPWAFSGQRWATYIPAQCGNEEQDPGKVNAYVTSLRSHTLPVLADEFGILQADSVAIQRSKLWAVFCGGAAGVGTGSDLKAFQRFLARSRVPFQRMSPANDAVEGGGTARFCLAEAGRHYVVYSTGGAFTMTISGKALKGRWFNPRDANGSLSAEFRITAGSHLFTPPDMNHDWVLWVTDGLNLNKGVTHLIREF